MHSCSSESVWAVLGETPATLKPGGASFPADAPTRRHARRAEGTDQMKSSTAPARGGQRPRVRPDTLGHCLPCTASAFVAVPAAQPPSAPRYRRAPLGGSPAPLPPSRTAHGACRRREHLGQPPRGHRPGATNAREIVTRHWNVWIASTGARPPRLHGRARDRRRSGAGTRSPGPAPGSGTPAGAADRRPPLPPAARAR